MPPFRRAILTVLPAGARRTLTLLAFSAFGAMVASSAQARLLVSDPSSHHVSLYNGGTGAFIDNFIPAGSGGLQNPNHLTLGPDNNLYVSDPAGVLRYDGQTGVFLNTFIPAGSGGLFHPTGLTFGSDGNLYVSSASDGSILRFDGGTGAFIDVFVPPSTGRLQNPDALAFGPDGNLYISSDSTNSVLRYNGQTGAFLDTFVPAGSGGLDGPGDLVFGADGNLYLSSSNTNSVLRYNGHTGAFLDTFVSAGSGGLDQPEGLTFAPDGSLCVASRGSHSILRYSGQTGAFLAAFVPAGASASTPGFLLFTLDAPSRLSAAALPPSQIRLWWANSSDDATGFAIWRKSNSSGWTRVGVVPPSFTSFVDTGVSPNQEYTYRVRAISNTIASAWSGEASLTLQPPPAAPTRLTGVIDSPTQIQLSWTDNSDNETAFAIWRKSGGGEWRRVGVVPPNTTTFIDANLTPGIPYIYLVRAINNTAPSDWTNRVSLTTGAAPAAPTNLAASGVSGAQVQLTWTDNSNNETAFAIWRKSSAGEWKRVGVVPPNTTSYTDADLTPGTTYTYMVRATNNIGPSDWTDQVHVTTSP